MSRQSWQGNREGQGYPPEPASFRPVMKPGPPRYSRPVSSKIKRISTTSPMPPLGPYPQLRLWGHAGMAPTNISTRRTIRIVTILVLVANRCKERAYDPVKACRVEEFEA